MSIVRNPIPDAHLHPPRECDEQRCREKRERDGRDLAVAYASDSTAKTSIPDFKCPNFNKGCAKGAFLYPRKIKVDENFAEGYRIHYHQGIDIGGVDGLTQIISVVNGKVREASAEPVKGYGGYGRFVEIEGEDGLFYLHAHCAEVLVKKGDSVKEQDRIAIVGRTGFETPEETVHEIAHCERLKAWREAGHDMAQQPQPPKDIELIGKDGRKRTMGFMGQHLHFEVSKHPFGSSHALIASPLLPPKKIKVDRSIEGDHKDFTEDPRAVLEGLGDWGQSSVQPVYFPTGELVTPQSIEPMHERVEHQDGGGYFPIGANNYWHGGVHLRGSEGKQILTPLPGTIVAVRLDEDPARAVHEFGSANFILLKHEIAEHLAAKLAAKPSSSSGGSSAPAVVKVGAGGKSGNADYVLAIKRMLHAIGPAGSELPFYAPADEGDVTQPAVDEALIGAIRAFQQDVVTGSSAKKLKVNGTIAIPGSFWNALRARADAAEPESEPKPSKAPAPTGPATKTVYSLYMHLQPAKVDAARAKEVSWLSRAKVEPRAEEKEKAERERAEAEELERAEASYEMTGAVGPANSKVENLPADVTWVKRRLIRLGYYEGAVDEHSGETLVSAIRAFQGRHGPKQSVPDGIVGANKGTCGLLKKTPTELGLDKKRGTAIDPEFLRRIRETELAEGATGHEIAKVVSGLSVPVQAGDVLWTMGAGSLRQQGAQAALTHWEIFSEHALIQTWTQKVDTTKDLLVDATVGLVAEIESVEELEDDEKKLSANEVSTYFRSGLGKHLRTYQCQFHHEAAFSPADVKAAAEREGDEFPEWITSQVAPYLWWQQAADVLPGSALVWHYNPIEFVAEYARASGLFAGQLIVRVTRLGRPVSAVLVMLSSPGQPTRRARANEEGLASFGGLIPGRYRAEVEDSVGQTSGVARATANLGVRETAQVEIKMSPVGSSSASPWFSAAG